MVDIRGKNIVFFVFQGEQIMISLNVRQRMERRIKQKKKLLKLGILALHYNSINRRVIKPHGDENPALVAIAVFLRHSDNIAHIGLSARARDIPVSALFPKQAGMVLTEPN